VEAQMTMETQNARRTELKLVYDGADISRDIAPYLISFSYTDNASDKADDLSLTLEDREGNWRGPWFPSKGATIHATIVTHEWRGPHETESLPCGTFEIDDIECSGPPTQVQIKAVSTLISKSMRQEQKTKAWEDVKLSAVAGDIAKKNGLKLFWDSPNDPLFERRDQVEVSDLGFLQKLCRDYGIGIKVTETQIVCYDEETYEAKAAIAAIFFGDKHIRNYRFRTKTRGTYKGARLQYHHPVKNENLETYTAGNAEGTGEDLVINQKADTLDDAEKIAQKKLHDANKKETTGSITLVGDMRFLGGSNVDVSGWGKFDGRYFIEKATHNVNKGSGYVTSIELRLGGPSKKGKDKKSKTKYGPLNKHTDVYGKEPGNQSAGGSSF
jgi:phage protein D